MSRFLRFAALLTACMIPWALAAQTADTATIRGHVTDPSHAAVAGVQVTVTNPQTGVARTVTTDANGNYTLSALPIAGTYTLRAEHSGFAAATAPNLSLIGGSTAEIDLHLNAASSGTTINVTGVAGAVRTDEPQMGEQLNAQQIAEMPMLGNQITALPLLNSANRPSINMGDVFMNQQLITTNGAGRREADFVVDGVNSNDDWARQTIFTALPDAAVQEMTVLENGFSAEYGTGAGGVVNIVTASGTDKYHGMVDFATRPNGMAAHLSGFTAATATGGNDQTSDELAQGEWSFSGPLGKNTQFDFSGELTSRHRASPVTSPLDPTSYVGIYHDGMEFGRVDHQFSANHTAFIRADADSFYDTNPNGIVGGNSLPSVARVFSRRTYEGVIGDDYVLSPNLVNAARLQFQLADPITAFAPVNDATAFSVPIAGEQTFTSGTSTSARLINRQFELGDTLSDTVGAHSLQFGLDGIFGRDGGNSKEFGGPSYLGVFSFPTCGPIAGDTPAELIAYCESPSYINISNATSYTQPFGDANYEVSDTIFTGFLQDDFHFSPNLTLDLGVSYMRQTFTQSTDNWAPHVGFVYSPMKNTVVSGSYVILYSPVIDDEDASYALGGPTGVINYSFNKTAGSAGTCFPTSFTPYASVPSCATAPGAQSISLYLQPGMASYYNQFFPVAQLDPGYQSGLWNPYTAQWTFGIEHQFSPNWTVDADYVGSHTINIMQPIDVNAPPAFIRTAQNQWRGVTNESNGTLTCNASGQTNLTAAQAQTCATSAANAERPLAIYAAENPGTPDPYGEIQTDENDGVAWYDALELTVNHRMSRNFQTLVSYTWSHTLDTVDWDATATNPNNALITGAPEKGNALWDQPQRLVWSGVYSAPYKINLGGITTLASGLSYNLTTGTSNDGDSADTSRPVIDGEVVGRNIGRGTPIYSVDPFIERPFQLTERMNLLLRAESFDVLNHANFVTFNGTYGNGAAPTTLGTPSVGVTAQLPAREFQFEAKLTF